MQKSKGFTIIELLVVVAIIAVLTGIVLVNVTSYINKGKNASIKGNLSAILTNSAVNYDSSGNYDTFCTNAYVTSPEAAVIGAGGTFLCTCDTANCGATATKFCAAAMEVPTGATGTVFCVDYTGTKKETAATTLAAQCVAGACQ